MALRASDVAHTTKDLVCAHQAGDPDAFASIVRAYYPQLLAHARRRLSNGRDAEDAVQDTLLRAYRMLSSFGGDYQLAAWLHRILSNVCTDVGGRQRREAEAHRGWSVLNGDRVVEDPGSRIGDSDVVLAAIASLPLTYREALVLRDVMDLEYADVADLAGISEQNARTRVARARAAVRRTIGGAATAGVGIAVRRIRGIVRWVPQTARHVATSASTASPDAFSAPMRAGMAVTTVAAAFAAVTVVPALTSGPGQAPSASVAVTTSSSGSRLPATTVAVASAAPPVVAVPTTVPPETTTTSTPSTTSTSVPPFRQPAAPLATVPSTTLAPPPELSAVTLDDQYLSGEADGANYAYSGEAEMPWKGVDYVGTLKVTAPVGEGVACAGKVQGSFLWFDPNGQEVTVTFDAQVVQATPISTGTLYNFSGDATAAGDPQGYDGSGTVTGTFTVMSDPRAASIFANFGPDSSAPTATCPTVPTTSSIPSPTTLPAAR